MKYMETSNFTKTVSYVTEHAYQERIRLNVILEMIHCDDTIFNGNLSPLLKKCHGSNTKKKFQCYCDSTHEGVVNAEKAQICLHNVQNAPGRYRGGIHHDAS